MSRDPEADVVDQDDVDVLDPERRDMSFPALVLRRLAGSYEIDQWGFDADLAVALAPFASLRHRVLIEGAGNVPAIGAALLVVNHRFSPFESLVVAAALGRRHGRPIRCAGVPDLALIGPLLRRLGGVSSHPADLRSLLRAGEVVMCANQFGFSRPFGGGRIDRGALETAMATGAPVVPVKVHGHELGRDLSVTVGAPISMRGSLPGNVDELATLTDRRLAELSPG